MKQKSYNIFTESLSFKNFPFNELYTYEDNNFGKSNQYITFWKYIIYLYICKMMSDNESISSDFRNLIKDIIPDLDSRKLSRVIKKWTGVEFGVQLMEKICSLNISLDSTLIKSTSSWIEKTNILEDLIGRYCDSCEYYIVFDELDEDYSDSSNNESYISLLKGLFKAVQGIRSVFQSTSLRIKPVIFLRDDIYAQIKDSDKNKWSDFKLELLWTPEKLKKLLAYRISRENNQIDLSFDNAWNRVFEPNLSIKYGDKKKRMIPVFEYILKNTHLRPRDVISYLKCCCSIALQNNRNRVGFRDVKDADREFSNYFKTELEDEITPLISEMDVIWRMITEIRKPIFSEEEFRKTLLEYQENQMIGKNLSSSGILETLFNFSVLGNQHKTQTRTFFFKYQQTNMTYNRHERLVVHKGLLKSLQLI